MFMPAPVRRSVAGLVGFLAAAAVGSAADVSDVPWPDTDEQPAVRAIADLFEEAEVLRGRDGALRAIALRGGRQRAKASLTMSFDPQTGRVTSIKGNSAGVKNDDFALFVPLKDLRLLSLHHNSCDCPAEVMSEVCDGAGLLKLKGNAALEEVMMPGGPFDQDGLAAIAQLPQLKRLGAWHVRVKGEDFAVLRNHPGLESVRLGQTWDPTFANTALEHLSTCPNFKRASIGAGYLTWEDGLRHLVQRKGTFEVLDMKNCVVAPEDLERLKKEMPDVEVNHDGMAAVGKLIAGRGLKKLSGVVPQELLDRYVAAAAAE